MRRKRSSTPIARLYILPPIVLLILLGIFAFILANQRAQELQNLEERMQLQSGLIAEKISSRMHTYEMLLEMLESQIGSGDVRTLIQRQLLLNDELEGIFVLDHEGAEVGSTYPVEFPELARLRAEVVGQHLKQHLRFSLTSFTHHGERHMVISRDFDTHPEISVIALVVETNRFFEQLSASVLRGMMSALLYEADGTVFAAWDNPSDSYGEIATKVACIDEVPLMRQVLGMDGQAAAIRGGSRIHRVDERMIVLSSTIDFPMTLALIVHVPTAMGPFDRSLVFSLLAVLVLMLLALLLDHRYVKQGWEKEKLQQQMVQELSVQVQERTAELEKLSVVDNLTGLANRRRFNEEFEHALVLHESIGITCSILAIDLDGFKQVNDTLGHLVGDKVLVHITSILAETLGKRGTVARWGGDELMVLLPESDQARSAAIAEELRSAIESIPYDRDVRCTISIGVAEHLMGESSLDLIRRADDALYRAKGEGKNRLVPAPHRKRVRSESR